MRNGIARTGIGAAFASLMLLSRWTCFAAGDDGAVIDPMDSTAHWAITGQRVCYTLGKTKLDEVKEPLREGTEGSLKFTYDLGRRHWVGVQWKGDPFVGRLEALSFRMYGDGSKHQLAVRLEDANDRRFNIPLGAIDWQGWRKISVPMEQEKWQPILRHAEEPLPLHPPLRLYEIRIVKADPQAEPGWVAFSDMRAACAVRPVDRVKVAVSTGAAANVFYEPAPVRLHASFANPTQEAMEGRVETVVVDWLEKEQRFDGGALRLAAGETVEREMTLPVHELGAYRAWVHFIVGDGVRETMQRFAVSREVKGPADLDSASPFGMGLYLQRFRTEADLLLAIKLAREAGVKWRRGGLSVPQIEPSPGRWAWEGPRWVRGKEGGAVAFSGGRDLEAQSSASLNRPCETGETTFSLRIKIPTFDQPGPWRTLLSKGETGRREYCIYWHVPSRHLAVSFGNGREEWTDIPCAKSDWRMGEWYDVVMTHRRADRSVRWWVNGAPAGEGEARFAETLVTNDLPLQIGRNFEFVLDDLAIYDRALPPDKLKEAKPVAHWTFDEGQGGCAADVSGNGNDAEEKLFRDDFILANATEAGISTYGHLMSTPLWMAGRPTEGLPRPWTVIPRLDEWSKTLEAIAEHYRERGVRTWEIWNEPNIEPFWAPEPSASEYYQVLAASYKAIKKADPEAVVLGCSLAGPHGVSYRPPYEFVEEVLKLGGGKVMDAISIHPYRQPRSPEESDYLGDLKAIGDLTAKYGRRLPIWISEVGWPADAGGSGETWATKMLPRAYLLAIAAGVKNIAWYDYHDDGTDPSYLEHCCGILYYDLTPKSGYFAYRTMATELAGMRCERELPAGEDATALLFSAGDRRAVAAWSHRGETRVAFRLGDAKEVESVDLMGNVERLKTRDGALLLALGEAVMFLRNVPESVEVMRPITCEPRVLKLTKGESGKVAVTIRNPFSTPLELTEGSRSISVPAGGERVVSFDIPASDVRVWEAKPPVWRSKDGTIGLPAPVRVVALAGRREAVFERREETSTPVSIPNSAAFSATDEVTVACCVRSQGPNGTWQAPVVKWQDDTTRNYGLYLGREKGELCFSASFEKGTYRHNDISAGGGGLFDGKWHRVAATYSKHDREVCLYVDGTLARRYAFDGGDLKPNDAPLQIAQGFIKPDDPNAAPAASVRDVCIWSRALTAEEILRITE